MPRPVPGWLAYLYVLFPCTITIVAQIRHIFYMESRSNSLGFSILFFQFSSIVFRGSSFIFFSQRTTHFLLPNATHTLFIPNIHIERLNILAFLSILQFVKSRDLPPPPPSHYLLHKSCADFKFIHCISLILPGQTIDILSINYRYSLRHILWIDLFLKYLFNYIY